MIERAFALLNAFDSDHRVLTLADLAHRSDIPRSSALRLARALVDTGALERLDDGRYTVGLRLLEIASLAPRGHGLRSVAMPFMEDLFQVTRQHVLLAVLDQGEALLVERLSALDASPVRYRVGGRLPLASTGVGLVLLAFAPPALQDSVIDAYVPGRGDDSLRSPADLRRMLAEVRHGDFAVAHQNHPWRMSTAAAPVRDGEGVVAALSVVAPRTGFADAGYGPAVRAAARAVSRQLSADGVRPPG
ncbi:IclR family transcriptional regulator [Streptomyces sp. PTY087I2]|uniref:IclR family transcriptional regulator n=1 Tax=Streptomyces sp. PTY087I2 TaxID=1819298 RepID=UPI000827A4B1|nr:IclR family transcriptional regulator [Streptomyces sp. PTY087I2]OCC13819.1 HTH-type transcriptional regulator KipR [Streptomyces sp. PTY087I2]